MHIIRVLITPQEHPDGEQWATFKFGPDELDYMLAKLRQWEQLSVPFEHTYIHATEAEE